MPEKVKAKRKDDGEILYVFPHEFELYKDLIEPAPSTRAESTKKEAGK
ncbi:hypothetical protein [Rothia amarae]